jgi:hypothetical protein
MAGQQRTSLPYQGKKAKSPGASRQVAHNVPMTSQPSLGPLTAKAGPILRRLSVAVVLTGCCLLLAQCSWLTPPTSPTADPSTSAPPPSTQQRTITGANLIKAADLPSPMGGGKVIEYHRNARSLDQLSVCQPQPLDKLGASAINSRSFKDRYSRGNRPFPHSSLDDQPDSYAVVLQFSDAAAAQRAKSIYDSWVTSCEGGNDLPDGIRKLRSSFSWSPVAADPAQAEVAEVSYQKDGASSRKSYFESVGLTVLEDRMMITVHLFYTEESPYSLNSDEEEAGFAHPQVGLVEAAATRLSE